MNTSNANDFFFDIDTLIFYYGHIRSDLGGVGISLIEEKQQSVVHPVKA